MQNTKYPGRKNGNIQIQNGTWGNNKRISGKRYLQVLGHKASLTNRKKKNKRRTNDKIPRQN